MRVKQSSGLLRPQSVQICAPDSVRARRRATTGLTCNGFRGAVTTGGEIRSTPRQRPLSLEATRRTTRQNACGGPRSPTPMRPRRWPIPALARRRAIQQGRRIPSTVAPAERCTGRDGQHVRPGPAGGPRTTTSVVRGMVCRSVSSGPSQPTAVQSEATSYTRAVP